MDSRRHHYHYHQHHHYQHHYLSKSHNNTGSCAITSATSNITNSNCITFIATPDITTARLQQL